MSIKAVIVDDELGARDILQKLLQRYCEEVQIVASVGDVDEAEKAIYTYKPDIVFLDIEMPDNNGFELLERFKSVNFEIIFTTAHEEYALKAFRYSTIDYLQKPIHYRYLIEAVSKYQQKAENKFHKERYELLFQNMQNNPNKIDKIGISTKEGFHAIDIKDIVYAKGCGSYTEVFLKTGKVIVASKRLKKIEALLVEYNFFKCHKSYIINLDYCSQYVKSQEYILMKNNDTIPLASRSKARFISLFHDN